MERERVSVDLARTEDGWQFLNRFRSGRPKRRGDYASERGGIKILTCQSAARAYSRSHLACPFLVHGFSEVIIVQPTFGKSNAKYEISRNRNVAEE